MKPLTDSEEHVARVRQRVIERTAEETGWSRELAEARGLSPSEAGVLDTIMRDEELTPAQRVWLRQMEVWGLIAETGDGRWVPTRHGRKVWRVWNVDEDG